MGVMSKYDFAIDINGFSMERSPTISHPQVYVLELNNGKYYVGLLFNINKSLTKLNISKCKHSSVLTMAKRIIKVEIDIETLLAIFRGAERLFIVLAALLSITYGWNLFRTRILSSQKAEFSAGDWTVKFASVGPGVFFALFGAFVLHSAVNNTFKSEGNTTVPNLSESKNSKTNVEYAHEGLDKSQSFMTVKVLNSLLADLKKPQNFSNKERIETYRTYSYQISTLRNNLMEGTLGSKAYNTWKKYRNDYRAKNDLPDERIRRTVEDVEGWANATL